MIKALTTHGVCMRCKRLYSENLADDAMWNVNFMLGVPVGLLCPSCQTPEESLEAESNTTMLKNAELVSLSSLDPTKRAELIIEMIDKSARSIIEKHHKKAKRAGRARVRVDVQAWAAEGVEGVPAIQGQSESFTAHAREIAAECISGALSLSAHAE